MRGGWCVCAREWAPRASQGHSPEPTHTHHLQSIAGATALPTPLATTKATCNEHPTTTTTTTTTITGITDIYHTIPCHHTVFAVLYKPQRRYQTTAAHHGIDIKPSVTLTIHVLVRLSVRKI